MLTMLMVLLGVACSSADPPAEQLTAASSQPINHGFVCGGNDCYPATVSVVVQNGIGETCSGTLVTPRWVLTARHCFGEDSPLDVSSIVEVIVNYDAWSVGVPDKRRFQHTSNKSGPVLTLLDPNNEDATDLALIRLDEPVPFSLAKPMHPPLVVGACGDDWAGTLVGFGGNLALCPDSTVEGYRQFSFNDSWERADEEATSWTFEDSWAFYVGFCQLYHGSAPGDSGGSLIRDSDNTLCGVIRGAYWLPVTPFNNNLYSDTAATDSPDAVAFWNNIRDAKGNWDGECPQLYTVCNNWGDCQAASDDMDKDGVPDLCDDCPRVWNPEQTSTDDDPDGDGVGFACDFCPNKPGGGYPGPLYNCNYETELARAYPHQSEPPVVAGTSETEGPSQAALDAYRYAFNPDLCDFDPCPRQGFEDDNGSLPASAYPPIVSCMPPNKPGCNCSMQYPFNCEWVVSNVVTLSPVRGADGLFDYLSPMDVGLRWCDCPFDTTSMAGRQLCQNGQHGCNIDWQLYTSSSGNPWRMLETEAAGGWPSSEVGAEYSLPLLWPSSLDHTDVRWNFLALPASAIHVEQYPGGTGGITAQWVHGILWASFPGAFPGDINYRSHTYQAGNAGMWLRKIGGDFIAASAEWWLTKFCPGCPEQLSRLLAKVNDPLMYQARLDGAYPIEAVGASVRDLYAQAATGALTLIEAAEPLAALAQSLQPGQSLLRAVGLDSSTSVAKVLTSGGVDQMVVEQPRGPREGSPVLRPDKGLVLSASQRRVLVVGGTVDGTPNAPPEPSAWALDIASNEWTEHPLLATERPGTVLGATYRMEDLGLYVVDHDPSGLWLRRWRPGGQVEKLAALPASWGSLARGWLVAGARGDLLLAVSTAPGATPEQALLARFVFDAQGALHFAGGGWRAEAVLAPPLLGEGITLVVPDPSGGRLAYVAVSELEPAPGGEAPVIFGWPSQALLALNSVWLRQRSVVSGDVAVRVSSPGEVLADGAELVVAERVEVQGSLAADSVRIAHHATVTGSVAYNELWNHGTIGGALDTPLGLPLPEPVPLLPPVAAGTEAVTLAPHQDLVLPAGSYGAVHLGAGSPAAPTTLVLAGGSYGMAELDMGPRSRLQCQSPCRIVIAGRLEPGPRSYLGPAPGSGLGASGVRIFVAGGNGGGGGPAAAPKAAAVGQRSEVRAWIFVPNGTLQLRQRTVAAGIFIGRDVLVGQRAEMSREGG